MEVIDVPGATGYIDTNFSGKAEAAIRAFREGVDLVYLHLEAPDECGHRGEAENKVRAIETIDRDVLGPGTGGAGGDGRLPGCWSSLTIQPRWPSVPIPPTPSPSSSTTAGRKARGKRRSPKPPPRKPGCLSNGATG